MLTMPGGGRQIFCAGHFADGRRGETERPRFMRKRRRRSALPAQSKIVSFANLLLAILPRHGLRREAQRHAAFARTEDSRMEKTARALESAVAAPLGRRSPRSSLLPTSCRQSCRVLGCGGKRSATPLSHVRKTRERRRRLVCSKAPSPLRFAGAVQDRLQRWSLREIAGRYSPAYFRRHQVPSRRRSEESVKR